LTCASGCTEGSAATNGICAANAATCDFAVTDIQTPIDAFADGELARLTVRCQQVGSGQLCATPSSAGLTDGTQTNVCGQTCAPLSCVECAPGDCNSNGALDAGDPICVLLCLLGQAPAGSDCSCASDCNCTAATEAADPICTVLRLIGAFSPDTCIAPPASAALIVDDVATASAVDVTVGPVRTNKDAHKAHVLINIGGDGVEAVAGLRLSVSAEQRVGRVRLSRRLRRRGFVVSVARENIRRITAVVMPPIEVSNIPAIGSGPVLRIALPAAKPGLEITQLQLGSRQGLPLKPQR